MYVVTFLRFMMYSTYHSSATASRTQSEQWIMKCSNCNRTSLIKSIRSAFSTKLNAAHVIRRSSSSKSSGRTILKMKPLGNARIACVMNTPHCFLLPPKSRDKISCSGGDLYRPDN